MKRFALLACLLLTGCDDAGSFDLFSAPAPVTSVPGVNPPSYGPVATLTPFAKFMADYRAVKGSPYKLGDFSYAQIGKTVTWDGYVVAANINTPSMPFLYVALFKSDSVFESAVMDFSPARFKRLPMGSLVSIRGQIRSVDCLHPTLSNCEILSWLPPSTDESPSDVKHGVPIGERSINASIWGQP